MPGTGWPSPSSTAAVSPTTKISGWPGNDRSFSTVTRPARSCAALSQVAAGEATTPAAQTMVRASMRPSSRSTPPASHLVTSVWRHHLDAHARERLFGIIGKVFRHRRQNARPGLDQNDARGRGIDAAEILHQRMARDLRDGARHLDAGRRRRRRSRKSAAAAVPRHRFATSACSNAISNSRADMQRVLDALQPRRDRRPFVMSEIGMGRPGSDDQIIVR